MEPFVISYFLVSVTVFLWGVYYWWKQSRIWTMGQNIPGPKGYPFLGNYLLITGKMNSYLPTFIKLFEDYGSTVRLWMGPRLHVLLKDPDDLQVILGDPKIRNRDWSMTKAMAPFFGNGLFSLRGDEWKVHRRLITPTFHFKILECFVEVFGRKSVLLVKKLEEFEGASFDVHPVLSLSTLDSICETAIGTAVNSLEVGQNDLIDALDTCIEFINKRFRQPWLLIDCLYEHSSDGRRAKPVVKLMHAFSETVITKKLDEFRRGVRSPGITTASNKRVSSFLDMLIEASETQGSILSPEEMRDEVTTMAVAGIETTATTMSFFLLLMAFNPEIQAELHREMDEVFGSESRPTTSEDMQHLVALERCIKETMRLFPIASVLAREIEVDVRLPSGYTLPAGCTVTMLAYVTHRDPRYFPDPDKFWPDRWLPEHAENTHPYAYIPFSAGLRNCVGHKYAMLQMKSTLSQILRKYRVTSPHPEDILQRIQLSVTIGIDIEVKERYSIQLHRR